MSEFCKCDHPRFWATGGGSVMCNRCACLSSTHDQPPCQCVRNKINDAGMLECVKCGKVSSLDGSGILEIFGVEK